MEYEEYITVESAAGEGLYRVRAVALRCGGDISVTVCGGTLWHVGAAALAQYEPDRDSATVSTVTAYGHRDGEIAALFAKTLSAGLKCTVSVSGGLHIDGASAEDIALLRENSETCLRCLAEALEEGQR